MSGDRYSEDVLIEQPAIELLGSLGWETSNCFHEFQQPGGSPMTRAPLLPKLILGEVDVSELNIKSAEEKA